MKHLRFGLMLNGNIVEKWQYNVVKTLIDNNIELALVVKNGNKQEEKTPITEKIRKYPYKRLFSVYGTDIFSIRAAKQLQTSAI